MNRARIVRREFGPIVSFTLRTGYRERERVLDFADVIPGAGMTERDALEQLRETAHRLEYELVGQEG